MEVRRFRLNFYNCHKKLRTQAAFGLCKSISGKYFIFWKCYFPERKMYSGVWLRRNSFYRKSILVFGSYKHFTENEIHFLQKIISHVWFVDHFMENNNFKHLHYLNKPVTVQKYSSKFKHLHCLNTSVTIQKYSSTSTSKIII